MVKSIPGIFFWTLFLVFFQVFILNNIQLAGFINPYVYVFVILMLPFEIPAWFVLIFSFLLGLVIDIFTDTPGMHAGASLIMSFFRPFVFSAFSPREDFETNLSPNIGNVGFVFYLKYSAVLLIIHHFALFYLEVFRFSNFFSTFFRVIVSWVFSMLIIILLQFLTHKPKQ